MHRSWGLPGLLLTCSFLLSPIFAAAPVVANPATELAFHSGLELPHARSIDPIVAEMFPRWTSVRIYLNGDHRGEPAMAELAAWAQAMRGQPVTTRLRAINLKVNNLLNYSTDMQLWHETDYWETPGESVDRGAADCEGFAILKMYLAKEAGISLDEMAVLVGTLGYDRTPHAVLGAKVGQVVVTLDNKSATVVALNNRSDFTPIYSIGVRGAYTYPMNWSASIGASSYSSSSPVAMAGSSVTAADSNAHPLQPAAAAPVEVSAGTEDAAKATKIAATELASTSVADSDGAMPIPPVKPSVHRQADNPPPVIVAAQDEPVILAAEETMPEKRNGLFGGGIGGKLEQVVSFLFR